MIVFYILFFIYFIVFNCLFIFVNIERENNHTQRAFAQHIMYVCTTCVSHTSISRIVPLGTDGICSQRINHSVQRTIGDERWATDTKV